MVVAIEAATFASLRATRATFLPLVVKHCVTNLIQIFVFAQLFSLDPVRIDPQCGSLLCFV